MADTQEHSNRQNSTNNAENSRYPRNFDGRRRFNRRAHMSVDRGLIRITNLFGPKGPSRILISRSQWEKHVRFVTSGVMDRWVQTHDTELYLRERDGDYNPPNRNSSTKDAPIPDPPPVIKTVLSFKSG